MKITLKQDWKSMIDGCTEEELASIDPEATQRAYEDELRSAVLADYPDADVDVEVTDRYFRYGAIIEDVDEGTPEMVRAHLETITDVIFFNGNYWRDNAQCTQ